MGPVLHALVLCPGAGSIRVLLGHFTFPKYKCTVCTTVRGSPGAVYPVCLVRMCGKQLFVYSEPGAVYKSVGTRAIFVLLIYRSFITAEG